jgi:hypothetical protein
MNRRSAPRFALQAEVLLVTAGPDGPELSTGHTVEVSLGGCTVQLDEPLEGAATAGVLLVRVEDRDLTMLTAPITDHATASQRVGLRFVAPTEPDASWGELVDRLAA